MKLSDMIFVIVLAGVVAGIFLGGTWIAEKEDRAIEKREAQEEIYKNIVAKELELEEKHIRYEGREREFFSAKEGAYMYRTDIGTYLVEFEENEIKTIVKK